MNKRLELKFSTAWKIEFVKTENIEEKKFSIWECFKIKSLKGFIGGKRCVYIINTHYIHHLKCEKYL